MQTFDVVVMGSGVGGLTTAIIAAQQGLQVLVVEKTGLYGGTTAYSGGVAWIPNHHHMRASGVEDSRDLAETYLRATLGNHYDEARIAAFLDAGPKMLKHLEETTALKFVTTPTPDYLPWNEGALHSRGVLAYEFDGAKLGKYFDLLRRPYPEFTVFDSMQVAGADITPLRKAFRSTAGFMHTTRLVMRYAREKLRHGRGTRLVSGNALAGRLLKSALDAGVTLWNNTPALAVVQEQGRVTGLTVRRDGQEQTIMARRAVVLASGGFGANPEMRARFMPLAEHHLSVQPEASQGDGINIGEAAGGTLVADNPSNAIFIPVSQLREANGAHRMFPHIMIDRYMPGSIAVDATGHRFCNEGDSYQAFVGKMHERGLTKVHLVGDRRFLRRYGMGLVRPFPYPIGKWLRNGYLIEGRTPAELARKIGVDPATLEATIARFNDHARRGEDPDFGRGADAHSRFRGDQEVKPNPSLAPLDQGPYYAIALYPGDLSTVAGLDVDEKSRVLAKDGRPVPGLYAVGLDMNSMTRGMYPAGGSSLGPALTFGYIAGRDIAGL